VLIKQAESQMRKSGGARITAGGGVAAGQRGPDEDFHLPVGPGPLPTPAVRVQQYTGRWQEKYRGTSSGDGIFNRTRKLAGEWQTDIEDQLDDTMFGATRSTTERRPHLHLRGLVVNDTRVLARPSIGAASWHYIVEDYKGKTICRDAGARAGATHAVAVAELRGQRGAG